MNVRHLMIATAAILGLSSTANTQDIPSARPKATFGGATPINIRDWYTYLDYPRGALANGAKGTVGMSFTITAKGRVDSCRVVSSTGNAEMDANACRALTRRARFKPARNAQGQPVATSGITYAKFWTE